MNAPILQPAFHDIPRNDECPWPLRTELTRGELVSADFQPNPAFLPELTGIRLWDAFEHAETEVSAAWIVRFLRERDEVRRLGWTPFTYTELQGYYGAHLRADYNCLVPSPPFSFNRLVLPGRAYNIRTGWHEKGGGWVRCLDETAQTYAVTIDFVQRVVASLWSQGLFDETSLRILHPILAKLPASC